MAAVEEILEKLRRAAAQKGPEWLRQQVGDIGGEEPCGSAAGEVSGRARRSRPPARFSPGPASRPVRRMGSPGDVRSAPPVKRRQEKAAPARSTRRRPNSGGGATGRYGAGSLPGERSRRDSPSMSHRGNPEGSVERIRQPSRALGEGPSQLVQNRSGRSLTEERVAGGSGENGRERSSSMNTEQGRGKNKTVGRQADRSGQRRLSVSSNASRGRTAPPLSHTTASGASPPRGLTSQESGERDDRSEGELSDEEEPEVPARANTVTAVGSVPGQPGPSS